MQSSATILEVVDTHLREWFPRNMPPAYIFHNFHQAQDVAKMVAKLGKKEKLPNEQIEIISLAGWFSFTGLPNGKANYQMASAGKAADFLSEHAYPTDRIKRITDLILSTAPDRIPVSKAEKVLDDAIHAYLGDKAFSSKAKLLRLEKERTRGSAYSEKEWSEFILTKLLHHNYYTKWAKRKLGKRKLDHIATEQKRSFKAREKTLKKKTGKNLGRGVDTLYRTTFRNHINLSQIADGKANMMISINTIVLSILIAASGAGISLTEDFFSTSGFYLLLPIVLLLLSSLTALVFAVFSAKPTVTHFKVKPKDPKRFNLLFFQNFLQLPKENFVDYLSKLKQDQNRLYDDMARDLYQLGAVLQKKYHLLSLSYNTFVGGLILSVLSFIIIYLL